MNKILLLLLSMATVPVYAQGILGTLSKYQSSLEAKPQVGEVSESEIKPDVKPTTQISSSSTAKCEENDQTSLPLNYLTSLILEKDGALDIVHNPRLGTLSVSSSSDMISNCSSMLEWNMKQPELQGKKSYALEVKFKEGESCSADGCVYKVAKAKDGQFDKFEEMVFKPTLKGFEQCLEKSGVITAGKVVPGNIYKMPINEKFSGLKESGKLAFLSHGPQGPMIKAKYGKFDPVDRCDYYETIHPNATELLTYEDAEKRRLDEEASKLKGCTIDEYHKVADFLEKYENYSAELIDVRDRLILEAAKKSAEAIAKGKYTDEDLKVIADFEKYITQPKVDLALALYNQMIELEGEAKKQKQAELTAVLAEISALKKSPYFTATHTKQLIKDGKFEDAEKMNSMILVLESHQRLGAKENNVVITPAVARQKIITGMNNYNDYIVKEKERYEIRTGQTAGQSATYTQLATRMRNNITARTQNYQQEIMSEYARIQQPNGHCFKYWVNTQKCYQDSIERIQELHAYMQHYNNVDSERAAEYEAKAKEYAELEAEGRRYIAAQNGEAPTPEVAQPTQPVETDTTRPATRPAEAQQPGVYSFNFNQPQNYQQVQNQAQMTPQNYQYPTNPYAQQNMFQNQNMYQLNGSIQAGFNGYGYANQQGFLGQQNYYQTQMNNNGSWNFNMNGAQQNQYSNMYGNQYGYQNGYQQGYTGYQPYMQYNSYNMYGRW